MNSSLKDLWDAATDEDREQWIFLDVAGSSLEFLLTKIVRIVDPGNL